MQEREEKDGCDYVCTHIDNFKTVACDPNQWMTKTEAKFLVKSLGLPSCHLGNNHNWDSDQSMWKVGCNAHLKEVVLQVENVFGIILKKECSPMPSESHPELDESPPLDDEMHHC